VLSMPALSACQHVRLVQKRGQGGVTRVAKNIGAFMSLHETGHVRLRHSWRSMDGLVHGRSMTKRTPWPHVGESGLPIYETEPCRSRGCWACQHKARRKLRSKVQRFIDDVVMKAKRSWRFVTLTLPGNCFSVREASVETQLNTVRRAFASWRLKMQRRGARVHGFYTIEFEGSRSRYWHTHVHLLMRWRRRIDYNELRKLWTESVDRKTRKHLHSMTDGLFTNDNRVVQVDAITSRGIADYCTKVTNYVTKGPKSEHVVSEIGKLLYRKRTVGWLGEYHGNKKANATGGSIPSV
jgi:hypothetical protein